MMGLGAVAQNLGGRKESNELPGAVLAAVQTEGERRWEGVWVCRR
jgi:hypothetical protein